MLNGRGEKVCHDSFVVTRLVTSLNTNGKGTVSPAIRTWSDDCYSPAPQSMSLTSSGHRTRSPRATSFLRRQKMNRDLLRFHEFCENSKFKSTYFRVSSDAKRDYLVFGSRMAAESSPTPHFMSFTNCSCANKFSTRSVPQTAAIREKYGMWSYLTFQGDTYIDIYLIFEREILMLAVSASISLEVTWDHALVTCSQVLHLGDPWHTVAPRTVADLSLNPIQSHTRYYHGPS